VLLVDEDVGHGALLGHLLQSILDGSAVILETGVSSDRNNIQILLARHTDLIKLESEEFGTLLREKSLGGLAVGAVGLGEDSCVERVNGDFEYQT